MQRSELRLDCLRLSQHLHRCLHVHLLQSHRLLTQRSQPALELGLLRASLHWSVRRPWSRLARDRRQLRIQLRIIHVSIRHLRLRLSGSVRAIT